MYYDLYFFACLLGFLSFLSAPISEKRTYKAARQTRKSVKARTPKRTKAKRTKTKKQKRYKAPPLSVEDSIRFDQYRTKRDGMIWSNGITQ